MQFDRARLKGKWKQKLLLEVSGALKQNDEGEEKKWGKN